MTKLLLTLATTSVLSIGASAANFIEGQYYGGVGMGIEDFTALSNYSPGVTLVINGGKPVIKLGPGTIGAEVEFTYTVVPLDYDKYSNYDVSIMTLATYATYTYDFNKNVYSRAKLGLVYRNYSWDYGNGYNYNYDYNGAGVAAGVGVGYKMNKRLRVFSDLNLVDGSSLKQINFGLQMNF